MVAGRGCVLNGGTEILVTNNSLADPAFPRAGFPQAGIRVFGAVAAGPGAWRKTYTRTLSWVLVAAVHLLFLAILTIAQNPAHDRRHRAALETMLFLPAITGDHAPKVNIIRPEAPSEAPPEIVTAPITIPRPPPIETQPLVATPGDVLGAVGQALACGAGSYENLNPGERARCRRQPWGGLRAPNGVVVLDPGPRLQLPPAEGTARLGGSEAIRRDLQQGGPSACPILQNTPCLADFLHREPGIH